MASELKRITQLHCQREQLISWFECSDREQLVFYAHTSV